ncbi:MAG: hypothetical protein IT210_04235 [Armatimonadetes bacterium]|nr:hypothetical protein [Armatimonadota bacterium]
MRRILWLAVALSVISVGIGVGGWREAARGQAPAASVSLMSKEPVLLSADTMVQLVKSKAFLNVLSGHLKDQNINLPPSALAGMLAASKLETSAVIVIAVNTADAAQARRIASLAGVSLVEYRTQMQRKAMSQFRALVDQELANNQKSLKDAEDAWVQARKNQKGDTPESLMALRRSERALSWLESLHFELQKKAQDARVAEWQLSGDIEIIDSPGE